MQHVKEWCHSVEEQKKKYSVILSLTKTLLPRPSPTHPHTFLTFLKNIYCEQNTSQHLYLMVILLRRRPQKGMNFKGHTLWGRVQVYFIWLTSLVDEMVIVFVLTSCTFKSTCFPVNVCDAYWLLNGWLSGWLVSWDLLKGVSCYSEPALGRLSTSCQDKRNSNWEVCQCPTRSQGFHAQWAKKCSQAFISNLTEKWLCWFFFFF